MGITKITKTELLELTSTTGAVRLPSGTTAERPSTNLNAGDFRYNTDDNKVEYYDGSNWFQIDDEGALVPSENFNTVLYNANDASQAITGVGFQPDFVWIKRRSSSEPHALYDSVRGINEQLESNSSAQQATNTAPYEGFTSFDSDGFTVGNNGATNRVPNTYVGWCFKGGGAPTATNSSSSGSMDANSVSLDGVLQSAYTPSGSPDIYPQKMSINTKAGFSIVSYLTNGNSSARVPHGLGVTPKAVLIKKYSSSGSWHFMTTGIDGSFDDLILDEDYGASNSSLTAPDDNTFAAESGTSSVGHICYSFCDVDGYQKIGSYTGNGSANGPIVEIGFEPAFLLIKQTNTSGNNWVIYDNKRDPVNARYKYLSPNNTDAEGSDDATNYPIINFLTNGFQIAGTDGRVNTGSGTYIYLAIAADEDTTTPTLANSFKTNLYTGNGVKQTIGGHINGAAQFNGSTSTIAFNNPIPTGSKTSVSFSLWLNFNNVITSSFYGIFGTQVNSQSPPFVLNMYGSSQYINASFERYENGNQYYSSQYSSVGAYKYEVGRWYHLACSYDSSTDAVSIYIDGAHLQTYTIALQSTGRTLTNLSFIGAYDTYAGNVRQSFNGSIDQVRIYDSTLTASEVLQLYNETSSTANTLNFPTGAGCVAAYPLDTNSNDLSGSYNGTDSNITYSDGPGFLPSFVWIKARNSSSGQPTLFDSLRGPGNFLESSATTAAFSYPDYGVISFSNDSFTVSDVSNGGYRVNGASGGAYSGTPPNYVGWTWKGAVNLPTINTDGSITSIVSANPASGFSVVRYTGNGGSSQSVGHGLNSAPEFVIFKRLDTSVNWFVFVLINGTYERFEGLNTTSASTSVSYFGATSNTITWTGTTSDFNGNGNLYLMYCFHSVSNYCKVGSYTGNGTSQILYTTDDGTSGGSNPFQPSFVLVKRYDSGSAGNWVLNSSATGAGYEIYADLNNQENYDANGIQSFNSNGFTVGSGYNFNASSGTYIYLAIK